MKGADDWRSILAARRRSPVDAKGQVRWQFGEVAMACGRA
jgi:hypothetical protein